MAAVAAEPAGDGVDVDAEAPALAIVEGTEVGEGGGRKWKEGEVGEGRGEEWKEGEVGGTHAQRIRGFDESFDIAVRLSCLWCARC